MRMSDDNTDQPRWVPALLIESTTTPKQRARNYAFYRRIEQGVEGDYRQSGLKAFVFEVPIADCSIAGTAISFRLKPESDCYHRLVRYVVGHTDDKCDADDEVERLRGVVARACSMLDDAVQLRNDADDWFPAIAALRGEAGLSTEYDPPLATPLPLAKERT